MIALTDPVALALWVLGLWCGVATLLVGGWVVLGEYYAWRDRRLHRGGEAPRVTAQPERFADFDVDVSWEWPGAR